MQTTRKRLKLAEFREGGTTETLYWFPGDIYRIERFHLSRDKGSWHQWSDAMSWVGADNWLANASPELPMKLFRPVARSGYRYETVKYPVTIADIEERLRLKTA